MSKKTKYLHVAAGTKYARDVVAGKIAVCNYVKLACKRHLEDLKRSKKKSFPYRFDEYLGNKICNFAELMPHIRGKWRGTPIKLEPWQQFALMVPFGWVKKSNGFRRFRELYWEIPRKNSKSTMGAIIGNYMLTEDGEPGAEVYSGATSLKQALEVFKPAWMMTKMSEGYETHYGLRRTGTNERPGTIHCIDTGSKFEPLIGNPGDGPSPHCAIVDEYHEHVTARLYNTQKTGMGSREQPLLAVITTAGTDTGSPCYDKRGQALDVLEGKRENEQLFVLIYTIDKDDDWQDFDNWIKANPNYGVSVFEDYLKAEYEDCLSNAYDQNILKCKHLNIWSDAASAWMNMALWEQCTDPSLKLKDFIGESCVVGIDLASKIDLTAMVLLFRRKDIYYMFCRIYLPEDRIKEYTEDRKKRNPQFERYAAWASDGFITLTPGNMVDQAFIEKDLKDFARQHKVVEVAHDPWNAAQFVVNIEKEALTPVEIPMRVDHISEPMKNVQALVEDGRFFHGGNPCFDWMMGNVVARTDANDNIYPRKERDENKIDGPVALIIAMARAYVEKKKRKVLLPT